MSLASIADPDLVPAVIERTLAVREAGEVPRLAELVTATTHVTDFLAKFGVETRSAAVPHAFRHGLA